jgi:hypothetical protein
MTVYRIAGTERTHGDLQNRIVDDVSQANFGFYEPARQRRGAALAHSGQPLVDFLSLAKSWPCMPQSIRVALVTITSTWLNERA